MFRLSWIGVEPPVAGVGRWEPDPAPGVRGGGQPGPRRRAGGTRGAHRGTGAVRSTGRHSSSSSPARPPAGSSTSSSPDEPALPIPPPDREGGTVSRPDDHDVAADEQDLLTMGEAAARVKDELEALRIRVRELEALPGSEGGDSPELARARERLVALEDAIARLA